jgi:tripartite-type tricarboxylate transporter receptor subunit TctC
MQMTRLTFVPGFAVAAALALPLQAAQPDPAKDYPNKPVRFIAPFVPGAGTDITTRTIAKKLSEVWGHQVVVDNRTGAAGAIGVDITAKAVPDGYTICLISASHTVNAATNPKLPYDLEKDLVGLSQASSLFYIVAVHPNFPAKSVKELIAYAKTNPGKINYGSSGTGGLQHFAGEMLNHQAGIKMVHVPYKGGAASIAALLSGEIQLSFTSLLGGRPHANSGRLRILAITAGKRSPAAPDYPTMAEAGVPGYEVNQWYGVVTSAKVPPALVKKLSAAIADAVKSPDVAERLKSDGSTPVGSTSEQFNGHIKSEIAKWRKIATAAGLKLH